MDKGYQNLIIRSFDDDLSSEEQAELQKLLLSSEDAQKELDQLRAMRNDLSSLNDAEFSSSFEDGVMNSIKAEGGSLELLSSDLPKKKYSQILSWVAGLLVLIVVGATFWFQPISHTAQDESLALELPDGTLVNLHAGSTLEYQRFAMRSKRSVELDGHAFFNVAKDLDKPFVVESFNAEIVVTGTQFDVNTKVVGIEDATFVFVKEGSVSVKTKLQADSNQASVQLSANQQTTVLSDSSELQVSHVDDGDKHLAARDGGLVFDNEIMKNVVVELEGRFGISFRAQSADILERRLTYFEKSPESLDQIVNDISHALGLNYTKSPEAIIFMHPNPAPSE